MQKDPAMHGEVFERLAVLIRTVLNQPEAVITPATTADDVEGWDSLSHSVLLMRVEREFGLRFDPAEAVAMADVGALVRLIEARLG
jgi:acyl carrier protein